ncbi:MAG: rRNA maturation RNase YbeY [Candidatus Limnocylindrales bacterium]|jgi:probable rRNA maturation factor
MTPEDANLGSAADAARSSASDEVGPASETAEGTTSSIYLPPFRIDVTVRPGVPRIASRHGVATAVRAALEAAGAPGPGSIGVVLSSDSELAGLNALHMDASGATDVLSFPFFPPEAFPPHERGGDPHRDPWVAAALKQAFALPPGLRAHLGDLIVSVERAVIQAAQGRGGQTGDVSWTPAEELLLLAVHGTLHICGWDHAEPVEEAAMRAMETRVMASLPRHDGHEVAETLDGHGARGSDPA